MNNNGTMTLFFTDSGRPDEWYSYEHSKPEPSRIGEQCKSPHSDESFIVLETWS